MPPQVVQYPRTTSSIADSGRLAGVEGPEGQAAVPVGGGETAAPKFRMQFDWVKFQ